MTEEKKIEVLAIIQARVASLRLPKKVLLKLDGMPLIQHTILKAKKTRNIDKVILATSDKKRNKPLKNLCEEIQTDCFCGSEEDVLGRFVQAAEKYNPKVVVRICGDEPFLDIKIIEEAIEQHKNKKADYSTTVGSVPKGLDVEIINYDILKKIEVLASPKIYREHVTNFITDNPDKFKILNLDFGERLARPDITLTVDTRSDYEFIKKIYSKLKEKNQLNDENIAEKIIDLVDKKEVSRKPIILLRADASREKGIGDVISLMNISGYLQKDYQLIFASKEEDNTIDFIKSRGYEAFSLPPDRKEEEEILLIKDFCRRYNIKYCITELVPQNPSYIQELSQFLKIMVVDFFGKITVCSDILLNWDINAGKKDYNFLNQDTIKMLGTKYLPLTKNILRYKKASHNPILKKITASFGGGDSHNLTFALFEILSKLKEGYEINFILGPNFKEADIFKEKIKQADNPYISYIFSPKKIYGLFSKSDLVICGGGLTSFELAALGVPFIGISKTSWEIDRLKEFASRGIGKFIEFNPELEDNLLHSLKELSDIDLRSKMGNKGRIFIDGQGASRIAKVIKSRWG